MKKSKSFTITEIMISMLIFILVISGSIVLITQTITAVTLTQSRAIAFNLAQEGIEITRNIRDNNWLEQRYGAVDWDDGLIPNVDGYEADYKSLALTSYIGKFLSFDSGFYSYSGAACPGSANCTRFKRKITIEKYAAVPPDPGFLYIKSTVLWNEKGKDHVAEVSERLYNWYGID
ncbi:MAG: type II secretion system protein [Parcubacteria group bacterium]|nr:MAG: type II secretion system protein [Parcubacteria group bacterium]